MRVPALAAPVDIVRDRWGIPHIWAASLEDAFYALGYVHAQDRLWQMEMNRRIASGRLAEILGPGALEIDRFMRTLGVRRAAERGLAALSADTRRMLDAYAAGVNAFLAATPVLPIEFWLTGARPEPWTPADSLAWVKMMAWDLGANWRNELLRMRLARSLPAERIHQLLAAEPGEPVPALPDLGTLYGELERDAVQLTRFAPDPAALGSNNWAVAGDRSLTGRPLLANDPHLDLSAPPVWYFAHLSAPGVEAIGATLPGVPAIVLGRTDRIAWAFTNTGSDVQDLYIEKLDGAGGYRAPDGPRDFEVFEETIEVKGREPVRLRVRATRHGPVVSDAVREAPGITPRGHVLALAWTALEPDDRTLEAALGFLRARNWEEFLAAARDFHTPQQNILYADVDGRIGFVAAGRVPLRRPDNDLRGLAPAPGWQARYDWVGWVPFDELPRRADPPEGLLWSANERIVPAGHRHHFTHEWQPDYRARRIAERLRAAPRHGVGSFAALQADVVSLAMRELLPHFLAARPRSEEARRALAALSRWDGAMTSERAEPLVAWAWLRAFTRRLYADELGEAFPEYWAPRAAFVAAVLARRNGMERWCDDVRTSTEESCAELLALSLEDALADLRRRYGSDSARWRWGEAHRAWHEHRPFARQRWLARLFDIRVPSPGDAYTVNVGRTEFANEERPYTNRHAASLRAIYDLADLERSLFIHSGGQSGNVLSRHYAAYSEAWARGEYVPMRTNRATIEAEPHRRLRLLPAR